MTMTRDEFAAMLNGRQYRNEMTRDEERMAYVSGLLVVFGASDDLTEFSGVIADEAGAWDGHTHYIKHGEKGFYLAAQEDDGTCGGVPIEAVWSPNDPDASWLIKPSVPFASFDIMEDDDLYCRGAVIDAADLLPKQRVVDVKFAPSSREILVTLSDNGTTTDLDSLRAHLVSWEGTR